VHGAHRHLEPAREHAAGQAAVGLQEQQRGEKAVGPHEKTIRLQL
jgi:hypothetical protein